MEKNYQVTPKGLSKICHTIVAQKGFCKLYNLVNNFDTIQKEKKKHRCGSCEKLFSRNYSLKKHIHTVHEGRKDYKCEFCNKSFKAARNLKRHVYKIHE